MTAKDFVALAGAIRDSKDALIASAPPGARPLILQVFQGMATDVAKVCARQNPRFDKARFLTACGMGQ